MPAAGRPRRSPGACGRCVVVISVPGRLSDREKGTKSEFNVPILCALVSLRWLKEAIIENTCPHTPKKSQSHTSVRFSTCQLSVRSQGVCETLKHFNGMRFYWGSVSRKGPRREASKHVVLVPNFLRHATHGCLHLARNH